MSVPISGFMLSRSEELLEGTEVVTHGVRGAASSTFSIQPPVET
jgi:hypothetical protein